MTTAWITPDTACYTIAFTMRSGSNLLCDYLMANGFGLPTEYFQHPLGVANVAHYRDLGVAPDDFRTFVVRLLARRSHNGIFGAKLTWDHKNVLCDALRRHFDVRDGLAELSPRQRWVYQVRRDKIGQAISLVRAFESGIWTSSDAAGQASREPEYDFFRLLGVLQSILTEEYLWEEFFQQQGIEPIRVVYEELEREPVATVFRVAGALQEMAGVELIRCAADVRLGTTFAVQRDQRSEELAARMRDDLAHLGVVEHWQARAPEMARWNRFFNGRGWRKDG